MYIFLENVEIKLVAMLSWWLSTTGSENTKGANLHCRSEEDWAFNTLKNEFADVSLLAFFDKDAPTEVVTDASPVGLGVVVVQQQEMSNGRCV